MSNKRAGILSTTSTTTNNQQVCSPKCRFPLLQAAQQ